MDGWLRVGSIWSIRVLHGPSWRALVFGAGVSQLSSYTDQAGWSGASVPRRDDVMVMVDDAVIGADLADRVSAEIGFYGAESDELRDTTNAPIHPTVLAGFGSLGWGLSY